MIRNLLFRLTSANIRVDQDELVKLLGVDAELKKATILLLGSYRLGRVRRPCADRTAWLHKMYLCHAMENRSIFVD